MRTPPPTAAAILGGGAARRLSGAAKGTLEVGGLPIVRRQIAALRHVADPVFIVAGDETPYRELGLDLDIVPDLIPGSGALGGIYTAIVASPRERTLVIACDMPFLSVALFQRMTMSRADLVVPRTARGYEPLCALYTRACAQPIRDRIERGELEASVLPSVVVTDVIGPEALAAYDPHGVLFVNVNTPHDYERARQLAQERLRELEDRIMDEP